MFLSNIMTKPKPILFEPDTWLTSMVQKLDKLRQTEVRIEKIKCELRGALHELQHQKDKYQALSETADCGIVIYRDKQVIVVNPVLEKLLGYTEEELMGNIELLNKCYSKEDLKIVKEHKYSNDLLPYIVSIIHKDGSSTKVRLIPKMVNYNGCGLCRAIKVTPYKERHA